MTERPILFNGEMVRAVLEGRKTQTRRVIKPVPPGGSIWSAISRLFQLKDSSLGVIRKCPYGVAGDRLWVRETWALRGDGTTVYRATYKNCLTLDGDRGPSWKPSIHMYRKDSRINIEVTAVRVERVQDISIDDCIAEGIYNGKSQHYEPQEPGVEPDTLFCHLWDSINAKRGLGWDVNPWVWVVEFNVVT